MSIGVYCIESPTGKKYVGSSVNIEKRWKSYKSLRCKDQYAIYASLVKHGVENHVFSILQECSREELYKLEREYALKFDTLSSNGLNCKIPKEGELNCISDETKARMSISAKIRADRGFSEEHRAKIAKANTGKVRPLSAIIATSEKNKGRKRPEQAEWNKQKFTGRKLTDEHKRKISAAGVGRVFSQESRDKKSKSLLGRVFSNETKQMMSDSKKKIILDMNSGIFFMGTEEAAFCYGKKQQTIKNYLQGTRTNKTNLKYV
jgi:group I intron endonuclease